MRRFPLAVLIAGVLFFPSFSAADVLKLVINDTIQPITAERIERALDQAAAHKDDAVLIELNTPGGLLESTREIIQKIVASPVPVIIYVTPITCHMCEPGEIWKVPTLPPWRLEQIQERHTQ